MSNSTPGDAHQVSVPDLQQDFKSAMRRLAATVCIVSTSDEDGWHGMTATSVTSVSMDPPSVLVCVNTTATLHKDIAYRASDFASTCCAPRRSRMPAPSPAVRSEAPTASPNTPGKRMTRKMVCRTWWKRNPISSAISTRPCLVRHPHNFHRSGQHGTQRRAGLAAAVRRWTVPGNAARTELPGRDAVPAPMVAAGVRCRADFGIAIDDGPGSGALGAVVLQLPALAFLFTRGATRPAVQDKFVGLLTPDNQVWAKNASALVFVVSNTLMKNPKRSPDATN